MKISNKNVVRLDESQFRKVIRKLIREAPLVDVPGGPAYIRGPEMSTGSKEDLERSMGSKFNPPRSIGYEEAPKFAKAAKEIFKNRNDNWAVILSPYAMEIIDDYGDIRPYENSEEILKSMGIKNWASYLGIPRGTKIIVSASTLPEDADTGIDWNLKHDIIGHGIFNEMRSEFNRLVKGFADSLELEYLSVIEGFGTCCAIVNEHIPGFQIAEDPTDCVRDLVSAIFFKEINKEKIKILFVNVRDFIFSGDADDWLEEDYREDFCQLVENIFNYFFEFIEKWAEDFPIDEPRLVKY